jgi:hypothetical protein
MTNGDGMTQGDESKPTPDPEPGPGTWDEPGDPGDFPVEVVDRAPGPFDIETRIKTWIETWNEDSESYSREAGKGDPRGPSQGLEGF